MLVSLRLKSGVLVAYCFDFQAVILGDEFGIDQGLGPGRVLGKTFLEC